MVDYTNEELMNTRWPEVEKKLAKIIRDTRRAELAKINGMPAHLQGRNAHTMSPQEWDDCHSGDKRSRAAVEAEQAAFEKDKNKVEARAQDIARVARLARERGK